MHSKQDSFSKVSKNEFLFFSDFCFASSRYYSNILTVWPGNAWMLWVEIRSGQIATNAFKEAKCLGDVLLQIRTCSATKSWLYDVMQRVEIWPCRRVDAGKSQRADQLVGEEFAEESWRKFAIRDSGRIQRGSLAVLAFPF